MIDYVGDLSRADALLLRKLAEPCGRILEFGSGASTQIFATYGCGTVDSVETDPAWIDKTRANLARLTRLGAVMPVTFHRYADFFHYGPKPGYDLIFVDGIDQLRRPFALRTWALLAVGGSMAFHDTRRTRPHAPSTTSDVQNVCAVIELHSEEIALVSVNHCDSNITIIAKRAPLPYEDWNAVEGRTPAQIGIA